MAKPTHAQQKVIDGILRAMKDGEPYASLKGSAGTGKTQTAAFLARQIVDKGMKALAIAHSHKQVAVLRDMMARQGLSEAIKCMTIAKAMCRRLNSGGKKRRLYRFPGDNNHLKVDVVIVDEASMFGQTYWSILQEERSRLRGRAPFFLFIGDPYQLLPVADGPHVVFNSRNVPLQFELTKIMRQLKGHPIIGFAAELREMIGLRRSLSKFAFPTKSIISDGVHCGIELVTNMKKFRARARASVAGHKPDQVRILAYTKKAASDLTDEVRRAAGLPFVPREEDDGVMYGAQPLWTKGEWVILMRHTNCIPASYVYSSQEAIVVSCGEWKSYEHKTALPDPEYKDGFNFSARPLTLDIIAPGGAADRKERGRPRRRVKVLEARDPQLFKEHVNFIHKQAESYASKEPELSRKLHREAHNLEDTYTEIISGYVLTTHRSQGSTHDEVFIDVSDIIRNCPGWRNKLRAIYVAVTRARYNAVIGCDPTDLAEWMRRVRRGADAGC